jgi:hypothetical protein
MMERARRTDIRLAFMEYEPSAGLVVSTMANSTFSQRKK